MRWRLVANGQPVLETTRFAEAIRFYNDYEEGPIRLYRVRRNGSLVLTAPVPEDQELDFN